MTRLLIEELHRCWAKLDGRAATIRRMLQPADSHSTLMELEFQDWISAQNEIDRLRGLLKAAPLCQACLGNPMVQECQPWCQEAERIRKADRQERTP